MRWIWTKFFSWRMRFWEMLLYCAHLAWVSSLMLLKRQLSSVKTRESNVSRHVKSHIQILLWCGGSVAPEEWVVLLFRWISMGHSSHDYSDKTVVFSSLINTFSNESFLLRPKYVEGILDENVTEYLIF